MFVCRLTAEMADQAARRDVKPIFAKKLHVLAALEVERHRKRTMDLQTQATMANGDNNTLAQATAATLDTLMMATLDTQAAGATQAGRKKSKAFSSAWHGAAAYHYYMLAQKQFYSGEQIVKRRQLGCCVDGLNFDWLQVN
jgi:WD repeat-containing protein 35